MQINNDSEKRKKEVIYLSLSFFPSSAVIENDIFIATISTFCTRTEGGFGYTMHLTFFIINSSILKRKYFYSLLLYLEVF